MNIRGLVLTIALCAFSSLSMAGTTTFIPGSADLLDLPHANYFTWGVNFNLQQGETITSATLSFNNIYDWRVEPDHLYTHLLDNPSLGTRSYYDYSGGGDNFANKPNQELIGDWSDPQGGTARSFNLVYNFDAALLAKLNEYAGTSVAGKANFGIGLDPDCHYFNDGVSFVITTGNLVNTSNVVPAPGAVLLGGIGMCLVGWLRSKRMLN